MEEVPCMVFQGHRVHQVRGERRGDPGLAPGRRHGTLERPGGTDGGGARPAGRRRGHERRPPQDPGGPAVHHAGTALFTSRCFLGTCTLIYV